MKDEAAFFQPTNQNELSNKYKEYLSLTRKKANMSHELEKNFLLPNFYMNTVVKPTASIFATHKKTDSMNILLYLFSFLYFSLTLSLSLNVEVKQDQWILMNAQSNNSCVFHLNSSQIEWIVYELHWLCYCTLAQYLYILERREKYYVCFRNRFCVGRFLVL